MKMYTWRLSKSVFPQIWKSGTIIMIAKPNKDHKKVENYRPITLLPVLGKLLEKIVKNLQLPSHNISFKYTKCRLKLEKTAVVCMDLNKAFNSMWLEGLLYKLHMKDTPSYLIHIVRAFLEDRELKINIKDNTSIVFTVYRGTPQGSPLSPLLYNIFSSDIDTPHIQNNIYYNMQMI
ncbi:hypothetical protein WA026_004928 [Henosepilachna vigintioctopunctata]|uniref:Reverse transcriptase domain-containing protein n=1 Tax=Henosepilachna vigintioctopunctata TaxID=420089 RepID=A0AAW1US38_9CUCU